MKLKDYNVNPSNQYLIYAKTMQNQIVKSDVVISGSYTSVGISIRGNYEQKVIKTEVFVSH